MVLTSKPIKASTSIFGLDQFSVEKAYKVRYFTPSSAQSSVASLTGVTPAECPKMRNLPFLFAHLPLPSMMIAMCWGSFSKFILGYDDIMLVF
jgi:hypothetical protein